MTRDELRAMTPDAIAAYFDTPEGQAELAAAPAIDGPMTKEAAVSALIQEAAAMKEQAA